MKKKICPRCGEKYVGYPALSRRDNKTCICNACGTEEAMFDFMRHMGKKNLNDVE